MARTYTLSPTSMHCGYRSSLSSGYWDGFIGADSVGYQVGNYQNQYRMTNILFNATDLTTLRSKTVTAIKLKLTFDTSTYVYDSTKTWFPIGYKYNNVETTTSSGYAWTRSNADSSAKATTDIGYVRSSGSAYTAAAGDTLTITLTGTSVPVYGYVLGTIADNNSSSAKSYKIRSASLEVTTNETLTLAYNANGGSGAPSSSSKDGTPNATFTISSTTPTRAGYQFLGWSTSSTATSASYSAGGSITLSTTGTTTLYAVWKAYTVTIKYNANGGTITTGTGTTRYRVSNNLVQTSTNSGSTWADLTATISTGTAYVNLHNVCGSSYDGGVKKTGYVIESGVNAFAVGSANGTLINQDTTSASDENAATIANLTGSATLTANVTVTLYIRWGVKIAYNANGASMASTHGTGYAINDSGWITYNNGGNYLQFVQEGKSADLYNYNSSSYVNLTYTGHHIKSSSEIWNTNASGTGTSYDQSTSYSAATLSAAGGNDGYTQFYANWVLDTYTVSYNKGANGTGTNTTDTKTYGVALTLKGAIFTRAGYTQTGWSTTDGGAKAYELGGSYTTNAATTLYPFWKLASIIHVRVGNQIKDGMVYVKQNGEMKIGIVYVKNNNTMKPTQ